MACAWSFNARTRVISPKFNNHSPQSVGRGVTIIVSRFLSVRLSIRPCTQCTCKLSDSPAVQHSIIIMLLYNCIAINILACLSVIILHCLPQLLEHDWLHLPFCALLLVNREKGKQAVALKHYSLNQVHVTKAFQFMYYSDIARCITDLQSCTAPSYRNPVAAFTFVQYSSQYLTYRFNTC